MNSPKGKSDVLKERLTEPFKHCLFPPLLPTRHSSDALGIENHPGHQSGRPRASDDCPEPEPPRSWEPASPNCALVAVQVSPTLLHRGSNAATIPASPKLKYVSTRTGKDGGVVHRPAALKSSIFNAEIVR